MGVEQTLLVQYIVADHNGSDFVFVEEPNAKVWLGKVGHNLSDLSWIGQEKQAWGDLSWIGQENSQD